MLISWYVTLAAVTWLQAHVVKAEAPRDKREAEFSDGSFAHEIGNSGHPPAPQFLGMEQDSLVSPVISHMFRQSFSDGSPQRRQVLASRQDAQRSAHFAPVYTAGAGNQEVFQDFPSDVAHVGSHLIPPRRQNIGSKVGDVREESARFEKEPRAAVASGKESGKGFIVKSIPKAP
ncbi:unnamed protein product [Cyprideis torosa]|uniref:Uncharacterized protein n=1 Tax=Cyprideis torosa TaxID=163714 RepID=A0A7R8ZHP4_9CRUS|nr:unnamed protein product [Cyprideis torosa]CAG0884205.1 unnamed protein product [Cyprideis torosa]